MAKISTKIQIECNANEDQLNVLIEEIKRTCEIIGIKIEEPKSVFYHDKQEWLSPVKTEREWQENQIKKLYPGYPNQSPKWQILNGLIIDACKFNETEID